MEDGGANRDAERRSGMRTHDYFLELCAVSTSGDLSEDERKELQDHLVCCPNVARR